MMKQKSQKLAGIMMLLYALATLLLPYVHDKFVPIGLDPGEKIIPDFALLVQLIALACSDLFLIPLVFAVMMLIGGILALKKPCVPVLIADGVLCICAYCYAGYLYRHSGAIFSELSGISSGRSSAAMVQRNMSAEQSANSRITAAGSPGRRLRSVR